MKNRCTKCGAKAESNLCWLHKPKKALARSQIKSKPFIAQKTQQDVALENLEYYKMTSFFESIWKKRKHESEVSGTPIKGEANSMYFHHILEKRNYKQAMYDEENIIILLPEEHASVELDKYKYEEINKRREFLKTKYNIL